MYRQHAAPKTQNERTSLFIRDAKRLTCARIAAFGVSALMAGQLLLPSAALAAETPETAAGQDAAAMVVAGPVAPSAENQATKTQTAAVDAASPAAVDAEPVATAAAATEPAAAAAQDAVEPAAAAALVGDSAVAPASKAAATVPAPAAAATSRRATNPGGRDVVINTTVVDHFYDLELPPAFTLIQDETFVYDFPDAPEGFTLRRNESVHFFKIDPDAKALVKTENREEANVSISLSVIDNHERATLVFTGGGADPLISYSLNLLHQIYIGAYPELDFSNFNNGEGTILETRHDYYIRCVFGSNVYLIATDTTDPEPDPGVEPDVEVKPDLNGNSESTPQPEAEKLAEAVDSARDSTVVKPAESVTPATGDSGAMTVALGAAAAAAAAASVVGARRRNR